MKLKGKIVQIVEHKDWKSYFNFKTEGEVVDVLNIRPTDEQRPPFFKWLLTIPRNIQRTIHNIIYCDMPYLEVYYNVPYFVKSPHNYNVGDYVEIEINISQSQLRTK